MSDTLERDLRRALADHAQAVVDHSDPWDRVQRGVVVRRRRPRPHPPTPRAARVLLRLQLDDGSEVVGVWTGLGGLGGATIDGQDAFLPLACGFRWFPVPAGSDVVVDGGRPARPAGGDDAVAAAGRGAPRPDPLYRHRGAGPARTRVGTATPIPRG